MKQRLWNRIYLSVAIVILAMPVCAHAQNGCLDSPENSTAVLLLAGSAGVCFKLFRRPRR